MQATGRLEPTGVRLDMSGHQSRALLEQALAAERGRSAELSSRLHHAGLQLRREASNIKESVQVGTLPVVLAHRSGQALQAQKRSVACTMLLAVSRGSRNLHFSQLLAAWSRAKDAAALDASRALCDRLFTGVPYGASLDTTPAASPLVPHRPSCGLSHAQSAVLCDSFARFERQEKPARWRPAVPELLCVLRWQQACSRAVTTQGRRELAGLQARLCELQGMLSIERRWQADQQEDRQQSIQLSRELGEAGERERNLQRQLEQALAVQPAADPASSGMQLVVSELEQLRLRNGQLQRALDQLAEEKELLVSVVEREQAQPDDLLDQERMRAERLQARLAAMAEEKAQLESALERLESQQHDLAAAEKRDAEAASEVQQASARSARLETRLAAMTEHLEAALEEKVQLESALEQLRLRLADTEQGLDEVQAQLLQAEPVGTSVKLETQLEQAAAEQRELKRELAKSTNRERRMQQALDEAAEVQENLRGRVEAAAGMLYRCMRLALLFATVDVDGSGTVEPGELLQLGRTRRTLGHQADAWTEQRNASLVAELDMDRDGAVSMVEFVRRFEPELPRERAEFDLLTEKLIEAAQVCRQAKSKDGSWGGEVQLGALRDGLAVQGQSLSDLAAYLSGVESVLNETQPRLAELLRGCNQELPPRSAAVVEGDTRLDGSAGSLGRVTSPKSPGSPSRRKAEEAAAAVAAKAAEEAAAAVAAKAAEEAAAAVAAKAAEEVESARSIPANPSSGAKQRKSEESSADQPSSLGQNAAHSTQAPGRSKAEKQSRKTGSLMEPAIKLELARLGIKDETIEQAAQRQVSEQPTESVRPALEQAPRKSPAVSKPRWYLAAERGDDAFNQLSPVSADTQPAPRSPFDVRASNERRRPAGSGAIPDAVFECLAFLDRHGLGEAGLWRDDGGESQELQVSGVVPGTEPRKVASLLLRLMRSLAQPLIGPELALLLYNAASDPEEFNSALRSSVDPAHRALLWSLLKHWRAALAIPATKTEINALAGRVATALFGEPSTLNAAADGTFELTDVEAAAVHMKLVKCLLLNYSSGDSDQEPANHVALSRQDLLRSYFTQIDHDQDGELSVPELRLVFGQYHRQFLANCDLDKSKSITIDEWVDGIAKETADISDEEFDKRWVHRLDRCLVAYRAAGHA